jgi:hypothetical protein
MIERSEQGEIIDIFRLFTVKVQRAKPYSRSVHQK